MIESIWHQFKQQLFNFIKSKVSDVDVAEDILQDVFVQVIDNINSLEDHKKLSSWLYQICRHKIIDHYRSKKTFINHEVLEHLEDEGNYIYNESIISCIQILILDLPEKYAAILLDSEIEQLTQQNIASDHNISLAATKSRIRRGRALLKNKLLVCCHFDFTDQGVISTCYQQCGCQSL